MAGKAFFERLFAGSDIIRARTLSQRGHDDGRRKDRFH
jgi:hypothetical protein